MTVTTARAVDASPDAIADRLEILELTSRLGLLIDARDWTSLEGLFVDTIDFDYTSLFAGAPRTIATSDLLEGWHAVESLDATQHLIADQAIELDGDRATCAANVLATHVSAKVVGDAAFTVGGRYDIGLSRTPDGWRITALKLTVLWTSGNRRVLPLADEDSDD